jgi:predicted TPR repeat methyltransferase
MAEKKFLDKMYSLSDDVSSDQIAEIYDEWAASYDSEIVDELGYAMPNRVAAMLPTLLETPDARILDIGCGTGVSGQKIAERGYRHIDGCDISAQMLGKAKALNLYERLFHADLGAPPIDVADASYDAVTVVGAFAYGHLKANALDEILRVVVDGGLIILTTNDHYYAEGSLDAYIMQLDQQDQIVLLAKEHGDHMPGKDVGGWVYALGKN